MTEDQDWTRLARAAIDEATTGAMDAGDGAFLLRTTADLIRRLWDQGLIPDKMWTRILVQGLLAVLGSSAGELEHQAEQETDQ